MHGVQPIAKIAPRPSEASQPPFDPTSRPPSLSPRLDRPALGAGRERDRAGRRREAARRARVERPPRPVENGNAQDPGQAQAEHDQDRAADHAERRQDVDEALGEVGGGHAEQREHRCETGDEGEGVTHRQPAVRPFRVRDTTAGDRDRAQLAQIRGHEREHARRQKADHPSRERDEDREVGAGGHLVVAGSASSASASSRRSFAALVASSRRRSPSSTTGMTAK